MPTEQAVNVPIEASVQKYDVVSRQLEQQSQAAPMQEQHQPDTQAMAASMGR